MSGPVRVDADERRVPEPYVIDVDDGRERRPLVAVHGAGVHVLGSDELPLILKPGQGLFLRSAPDGGALLVRVLTTGECR